MKILSLVGRNFHKLHDDKNDSATRVFPAKPRWTETQQNLKHRE